jgi:hypothetical protein
MTLKTTLIGLALSLPALAQANTDAADPRAPVFSHPISQTEAIKTERFAANPELGRAWVELDLYYPVKESSELYQIAVPGLRYDADRAAVVLAHEGAELVCATRVQKGWGPFRHHRIEPTGACALSRQYVRKTRDDGFNLLTVEHVELHLDARPSADVRLAGQS